MFHFAAFAYVGESVDKPSKYYKNNVAATLNLLDVMVSSVLQIIETAKKVVGRDIRVVYDERRAGDPAEFIGSNVKAREVLGWVPRYSDIETILRDAWNWHQKMMF